jgi:hypothetical protein
MYRSIANSRRKSVQGKSKVRVTGNKYIRVFVFIIDSSMEVIIDGTEWSTAESTAARADCNILVGKRNCLLFKYLHNYDNTLTFN